MGAANRDPDREDARKRQFAFIQMKASDGKGRGDLPEERRVSFRQAQLISQAYRHETTPQQIQPSIYPLVHVVFLDFRLYLTLTK